MYACSSVAISAQAISAFCRLSLTEQFRSEMEPDGDDEADDYIALHGRKVCVVEGSAVNILGKAVNIIWKAWVYDGVSDVYLNYERVWGDYKGFKNEDFYN